MLGGKVVVLGENGGDKQVATSKASNQQPGLIWFVGVFLGRVHLHFQCHKKIKTLPLIQDELDSWFGGGNRVRFKTLVKSTALEIPLGKFMSDRCHLPRLASQEVGRTGIGCGGNRGSPK